MSLVTTISGSTTATTVITAPTNAASSSSAGNSAAPDIIPYVLRRKIAKVQHSREEQQPGSLKTKSPQSNKHRHIQWKTDVIDNEMMNKKKSKSKNPLHTSSFRFKLMMHDFMFKQNVVFTTAREDGMKVAIANLLTMKSQLPIRIQLANIRTIFTMNMSN